MKPIFLITMALVSLSAQAAKLSTQHLEVISAEFNPLHVKKAGPATIKINYAKKQVTLFVVREFDCPPGVACPMVMPAPLDVTLPIVSIKTDSCGISTITATQDMRPVDGELQTITVEDFNTTKCRFFAPYIRRGTYLTQYYERFGRKSVKALSTMNLDLAK